MGVKREIYLDNAATTRCNREAAKLMMQIACEDYGNAASMHMLGVIAEKYIKQAKEIIAKILKVNTKEIVFTSGGTESNNLAIIGAARANHRAGKHIVTTKIEHPSVSEAFSYLEEEGFEVSYLSVDEFGVISLEELRSIIREDTILVSIMHTNNEIGSVQPIEEIGKVIKAKNPKCLFHIDAVQGFAKAIIKPTKMKIDMLSVSAHKFHGPNGVGFLYIGEKVKIKPIILGGGHQNGLRSGTENIAGVAGLGYAAEIAYQNLEEKVKSLYDTRTYFVNGLKGIEDTRINGYEDERNAPHIVSFSVAGVRSEVLLHALEDKGIYVSAGSACASNHPKISATLKAIGLEDKYLSSTLRFSISDETTKEDIDYTLLALKELIPMLRKYISK